LGNVQKHEQVMLKMVIQLSSKACLDILNFNLHSAHQFMKIKCKWINWRISSRYFENVNM